MQVQGPFSAPLFGIDKLIEYDVREYALENVIGRSYQSTILNQFLAQLEWIDAAPTLMNALATIDPDNSVCFIDGHMIPFWSRVPMHKGKITMLGRIMAGSQAVVAHTDDGRAVFFDYQPPDVRLSRIIVDYCAQVVEQTGIRIFVIDREVNSEAMATAFAQRGWGLLSMLDKNEYTDLSDWDAKYVGRLEDGAEVYAGGWAEDKKNKADDPRTFVLVVREGRILPYWGTPAVADQVAYIDWPRLYSQRTEIQENNFKRMKDHGALDVNFGVKKIVSEDRHHQRKLDQIQEKLEKSEEKLSRKQKQIDQQEIKVEESETKNHGKRLEQRRNRLAVMNADYAKAESKHEKIEEGIDRLGPAGERADRDFRKQCIMTLRTLLLENTLIAFMTLLMAHVAGSLSMNLDSLIKLLFERSGGLFETPSELVYLVNIKGLSKSNKENMNKLIEGLNKMGLEKDGKPVRVRARGHPNP